MGITILYQILFLSLLLCSPTWATVNVVRFPSGTPVQVCQPSDTNTNCGGGGGSMTWPSLAGIPYYNGSSAWGTNLALTVIGSSGASTLSTNTLNIPTYTLAGLGGTTLAAAEAAITPTELGLVIGTNVQAYNSNLVTYAGNGKAASLVKSKKVAAAFGTYSGSGQDSTVKLLNNFVLSAGFGNYATAGQVGVVRRTRILRAAFGTYLGFGQDATVQLLNNFVLSAAVGNYQCTGQALTIKRSTLLAGVHGTYVSTGQVASFELLNNFNLQANAGSYLGAGQSAIVLKAKLLRTQSGSFSGTGEDASLSVLRHFDFSAASGTYSTNGLAAKISTLAKYELAAQWGNYSSTGQPVNLSRGCHLRAQAGSYGISPSIAQIRRNFKVAATYGHFVGQGFAAQVLLGRLVDLESASYATEGFESSVSLDYFFEVVNPHKVHIDHRTRHSKEIRDVHVTYSARSRHSKEDRDVFFHQNRRERVIHEAIQ